MTSQMINIIVIILFVLLFVLIISIIPYRRLFERFFGNNPYKAKIYVEAGEQVKVCKGKYFADSPDGTVYNYKYFGVSQSVIVPLGYPFRYLEGKRQIRVLAGQTVANKYADGDKPALKVGSSQLNNIFKAHMAEDLAKSIFGKAINMMTILIIIGGVIFGIFFIVKQMQPGGALAPQTTQPPAVTQPVNPPVNNNPVIPRSPLE